MVYDCGCDVVENPNHFTTSAEMRFFWFSLSTMNCSREPFTHIWEWKRRSSSSKSYGSSFWIFVVETVVLGSTSIILFPLSFPFLGSDSVSEYASHYYILIQNPTAKSDGAWISFFKITMIHFFFVNVTTSVGEAKDILITFG